MDTPTLLRQMLDARPWPTFRQTNYLAAGMELEEENRKTRDVYKVSICKDFNKKIVSTIKHMKLALSTKMQFKDYLFIQCEEILSLD